MAKPILIALTNPVAASREVEFNRWYNDVHARDILSLPTVTSITRYRGLEQIRPSIGEPSYRYLAVYEMDDPQVAVAALLEARPRFEMSDSLGPNPLAISFVPCFSQRRD